MSVILSFGKWGGFYASRGYTWRVCLGFVALTIIPQDIDVLFNRLGLGQKR